MVTLTNTASEKVKEFLSENGKPDAGLRIRVVGGGCSGFQYQLALDEGSQPEDKIFEQDGIKVFVDSKSITYLEGTEIDYVEGMMGAGFKFNNPNSQGTCGCGESFQV